jgi:hypothetical protein
LLEAFAYVIASFMIVLTSNYKAQVMWVLHVIIIFTLYVYGAVCLLISYDGYLDLLSFIVVISIYYFALKSAFKNASSLDAHIVLRMKPILDIVGLSIVMGISAYCLSNIVVGMIVGVLLYASTVANVNYFKK